MEEPSQLIYLDHAAATPLVPAAADAQDEAYRRYPGNPSSIGRPGREAARLLRRAREELAQITHVAPEQVLFTSGGTESMGLAILGGLAGREGGHLVTSAIEHPAALESIGMLERRGFFVSRVAPGAGGVVDRERFLAAVTPQTRLACLMHANNELGTVQPVASLIPAIKEKAPRCLAVVDAVQSFTRVELDPGDWGVDMVALSGHKIGGPRGVGALLMPGRRPAAPLFGGGGQEHGLRPGTENVPGIAGFVAAAREKVARLSARKAHAQGLNDAFLGHLSARLPSARVNGDPARRMPWILSVTVENLASEVLLRGMEEAGVVVASGAACHARAQGQSHVLSAIGIRPSSATVRISFSDETTRAEVEAAVEALARAVARYAMP